MTRGKVVLVPFPFDDLTAVKVRPAVCLTEAVGPHRHVVLAFVSSRTPPDVLESDLLLDSSEADFAETGLRASSVLRLHRLMTVTTRLVRRELGQLSPRMRDKVTQKLKELFELDAAGGR